MQTRRTSLNHHQVGIVNAARVRSGPEGELIALAKTKGQVLTEHTLRLIRDTLELRGVALDDFVADIRPHFRNNILNPSGFLIDRARRFHQLSRPAPPVPLPRAKEATTTACGACKGQTFILTETRSSPAQNARLLSSGEIGRLKRQSERAAWLLKRPAD